MNMGIKYIFNSFFLLFLKLVHLFFIIINNYNVLLFLNILMQINNYFFLNILSNISFFFIQCNLGLKYKYLNKNKVIKNSI